MPQLTQLLDTLEAHYGNQIPNWPTDPYEFLVWWTCGYPASDASCAKGWAALQNQIGVQPDQLLKADPAKLAQALKPGGLMPELRAMRLKEIAERIQKEFGGDLRASLSALPIAKARTALKKFPSIADPGVDRILLFGGISPVPAVPSNCPHVLVRIQAGQDRKDYSKTYKEAQQMIGTDAPAKLDARIRAYLLLKIHGQQICKRTNPKCSACPVAPTCAFFAANNT